MELSIPSRGANDVLMLMETADIRDALDLLLKPERLVATLRG